MVSSFSLLFLSFFFSPHFWFAILNVTSFRPCSFLILYSSILDWNLLFLLPFIHIRYCVFSYFPHPRTSFVQVQVCISLTGHWLVIYSCGVAVPASAPCTITHACAPPYHFLCFHLSRPLFFLVHHYIRVLNMQFFIEKLLVTVIYIKSVLYHSKPNKNKAN